MIYLTLFIFFNIIFMTFYIITGLLAAVNKIIEQRDIKNFFINPPNYIILLHGLFRHIR